jgi:hypothetical protein
VVADRAIKECCSVQYGAASRRHELALLRAARAGMARADRVRPGLSRHGNAVLALAGVACHARCVRARRGRMHAAERCCEPPELSSVVVPPAMPSRWCTGCCPLARETSSIKADDFCRPVTAIRSGDIDGAPATAREATWQPIGRDAAAPRMPPRSVHHQLLGYSGHRNRAWHRGVPKVSLTSLLVPGLRKPFTNIPAYTIPRKSPPPVSMPTSATASRPSSASS